CPPVEALAKLLHALRNGLIAKAELAERLVHVAAERIEDLLPQLLARDAGAFQLVDDENAVEHHHLKPTRDGVGNAQYCVEAGGPHLSYKRSLENYHSAVV